MSLKIFTLQLLGKIRPVEKIELEREMLYRDYLEFKKVDQSAELSDLLKLEKHIHSDDFKQEKTALQGLQFKGSKEYNLLKEFEQLRKSGHIKKYFKIKDAEDFNRYQALRDSEKIKEYRSLLDYLEEGDFRMVKEELQRRVFKGSAEEKRLAEYNKLGKLPGIRAYIELYKSRIIEGHNTFCNSEKLKNYFELNSLPAKDKQKKKEFRKLKRDPEIKAHLRFEKSKKLRLYHETIDSYHLKRLEELKSIVESKNFKEQVAWLKDKKKFEKTEAYQKKQRFNTLAADSDVRFLLKFEQSALLKNYYNVKDSLELKRYMELKEIISSDAYKKQREYLEDSKKWEKTEAYAKEQRYLEMKKLPHFVNYFKYKGTYVFNFFEHWELHFEDTFSDAQPDRQRWSFLPPGVGKLLNKNFSMPGDLHLFTEGDNVKTGNRLIIETHKEKKKGLIWQMPAGFIPAEFDYTSGMVSSTESFGAEEWILEAKMKFSPVKETISSFVLTGDKNTHRIHLLESGFKNRMGIANCDTNGKIKLKGIDIGGLKKRRWYIFTLEKRKEKLVWKINNKKVLTLDHNSIDDRFYIQLSTLVLSPVPGSKLPVKFETDRIRFYIKK